MENEEGVIVSRYQEGFKPWTGCRVLKTLCVFVLGYGNVRARAVHVCPFVC